VRALHGQLSKLREAHGAQAEVNRGSPQLPSQPLDPAQKFVCVWVGQVVMKLQQEKGNMTKYKETVRSQEHIIAKLEHLLDNAVRSSELKFITLLVWRGQGGC
jgi:hypothetical protein